MLELTNKQAEFNIQNGSVIVKISDYYTATVRDLKEFIRLLNDDKELKKEVKVLSQNGDLQVGFVEVIEELITNYYEAKKPKRVKYAHKIKVVFPNDRDYHEDKDNDYWNVHVEINNLKEIVAEETMYDLYLFARENMKQFFGKSELIFQAIPQIYEDTVYGCGCNEYSDSFAVSVKYMTKGEFKTRFMRLVKAFKQANKK